MEVTALTKKTKTIRPSASDINYAGNNRFNKAIIQSKLTIGQPNDKYEQEADKAADQVMRMPLLTGEKSVLSAENIGTNNARRKCESCNEEELQKKPFNFSSLSTIQRQEESLFALRSTEPEGEVEIASADEKELAQTKPLASQITPWLQRQSGEENSKPQLATHSIENKINNTKGSGSPLSNDIRLFMEKRFSTDFSNVRIHNDSNSAELNRQLNSQAFTRKNTIYFNRNKYNPETPQGKKLLPHELAHTVQQKSSPKVLQKKDENSYWDIAVRGRELAKVPPGFHYEIIGDKLKVHITDTKQIDKIIKLLEILHLYEGSIIDKEKKREDLNNQLKTNPKLLDITEHLPPNIKLFVQNMHKLSQSVVKYGESLGKGQKVVTPTTIKAEMQKEGKTKQEIKDAQREWRGNFYGTRPKNWKEFVTVCHAFVALIISGTSEGASPVSKDYTKSITQGGDVMQDDLNKSVKGEGPYRKIPRKSVQIGDIAVFRSGKTIYGELDFNTNKRAISIRRGEAVHSAVVIKVSGSSYSDIEVFEKKNPWETIGTRTVKQILDYYKSDKVFVTFLAPALSGMPYKKKARIGDNPPSEPYTIEKGIGLEDTFVLFKQNTDITLPHEDKKLFKFIAENKTKPVNFLVHGYASVEGAKKYNLNLSAHRAVAVKKSLLKFLPGSSVGEAVAHGETKNFGSLKQNRRAGIKIQVPGKTSDEEIKNYMSLLKLNDVQSS